MSVGTHLNKLLVLIGCDVHGIEPILKSNSTLNLTKLKI
jgi:hypothetical protein